MWYNVPVNIIDTVRKDAWVVILIAIVLSFVFPSIGLFMAPGISWLLMALMFFSALKIDFGIVFGQLKHYKKIVQLLLVIHLLGPIVVFLFKPLLTPDQFLGFILAAAISSGLSVVFLSDLYGGKPSIALAITAISNILSPITVPAIVFVIAQTQVSIDPIAMSITIFKFVVIPLIVAKIIQRTPLYKPISKYNSSLALGVLFLLIMTIISPVKDLILAKPSESILLMILVSVLSSIGFGVGWMMSRKRPERITYAITSSYKNFTLASVVALSIFGPAVALPAAIYTLMNNLLLIPLQLIFLRKRK